MIETTAMDLPFFAMSAFGLTINIITLIALLMAVGLIMLGTLLAGHETLSANLIGYVFVMSNNILTAMLYIAQKKFIDDTGIKSFGLLYYNALIALPLSLCAAVVLGEFDALSEFESLHIPGFLTHHDNAVVLMVNG